MASENSPKGRLQINLACAAAVVAMLLAAGVVYMMSGSGGLQVPSSAGQAGRPG